jgi:hypothetical protein
MTAAAVGYSLICRYSPLRENVSRLMAKNVADNDLETTCPVAILLGAKASSGR